MSRHGAEYARTLVTGGHTYRIERVLKTDIFSVNVLYARDDGTRHVLKLSDFRIPGGMLFRPLAAWLSRHEYRIYQRIDGIPGIPPLGPRYGARGYLHQFIDGRTLHEFPKLHPLADDFFSRLSGVYRAMHDRRVVHVDSHKRGNIIVATDGAPYVIDFQISLHLPTGPGLRGWWREAWFTWLASEDLYHVAKHMRRYRPGLLAEGQPRRSALNAFYFRCVGEPYRRLKRLVYPKGSNETIWYRWKKEVDRTERMP